MTLVTDVLRFAYVVCIAFIALYAGGTLYLILVYLRYINKRTPQLQVPDAQLPKVTVQIPLYNERYVARRVVEAVAALDYPRRKLHIQILDDSTDDTTDLIQGRIKQLRSEGLRIDLIHRQDRTGYKAGALANGLNHTDGEFVAIFDADFIPPPDFLRRTIPHFYANPHEKIGMVQTRWGHLNDNDNILTRSQALAIDGHFAVEQFARCNDGIVFSFNGTGGVWRRTCIEEAGGWQHDTLTEDFDLSYRAQLKGWRFVYVRDVVVPGEIPPQMSAYKHQQARWAKGSTQVLVKLAVPLLRSSLSMRNRLLGVLQMMQYAIQLIMLLLLLLTPPMILLRAFDKLPVMPIGILATSAPILYALGQQALYKQNWWRRTIYFPVLLLIGTGLSLNNGRAAFAALLGIQSEFKRTPKYHLTGKSKQWTRSQYANLLNTPDVAGEIVLGCYSLLGLFLAIQLAPSMTMYLAFYAVAYFAIVGWTFWDRWLVAHPTARKETRIERVPEAVTREPEGVRQAGR